MFVSSVEQYHFGSLSFLLTTSFVYSQQRPNEIPKIPNRHEVVLMLPCGRRNLLRRRQVVLASAIRILCSVHQLYAVFMASRPLPRGLVLNSPRPLSSGRPQRQWASRGLVLRGMSVGRRKLYSRNRAQHRSLWTPPFLFPFCLVSSFNQHYFSVHKVAGDRGVHVARASLFL